MVEVPAAAVCIDAILRETDFISIGSNDLIQYLVAADRDNPKVAHLCEPLSPAIFRVLQMVLDACQRTGTPVTLCGEMAGQPRSVLVLFGMGLRRFSMSPAFVPTIKALLVVGHHRPGRTVRPPGPAAQDQRGDPLLPHRAAPRDLEHAGDPRLGLIERPPSRTAAPGTPGCCPAPDGLLGYAPDRDAGHDRGGTCSCVACADLPRDGDPRRGSRFLVARSKNWERRPGSFLSFEKPDPRSGPDDFRKSCDDSALTSCDRANEVVALGLL